MSAHLEGVKVALARAVDSLACLFGHAKPHPKFPRKYKAGVMHYQCPRCLGWAKQGVK
jgi:hypothetical protein